MPLQYSWVFPPPSDVAHTLFNGTEPAPHNSHMQIRYIGFDHLDYNRIFHFEVLAENGGKQHRSVKANLTLFPEHGVAVQDGPALCLDRLSRDLASGIEEAHELTAHDLCEHTRSRIEDAANRAAVRKSRRATRPD